MHIICMMKAVISQKSPGLLMQDVARLMRRDFDRRAKSLGLTQAQWQALLAISRQEGLTQIALAEHLEVQPISVARLIDRMENAGWVERRPDAFDRRAVNLYLAEKSRPLLDKIFECALQTRARAFAGIGEQQQEQLTSLLLQIKGNLCGHKDAAADLKNASVQAAGEKK